MLTDGCRRCGGNLFPHWNGWTKVRQPDQARVAQPLKWNRPKMCESNSARLMRLEARCRFLTLMLMVALMSLGAGLLMAARMPEDVPDSVKAKAFVLVDGNGICRATLTTDTKSGAAGLILFDDNRRKQVELVCQADASLLSLQSTSEAKIQAVSAAAGAGILLLDSEEDVRASLLFTGENAKLLLDGKDVSGSADKLPESPEAKAESTSGQVAIDRTYTSGDFAYVIVTYQNTSPSRFKCVTIQADIRDKNGHVIGTNQRSFFEHEYGPIAPGFKGTLEIPVQLHGASGDRVEVTIRTR